MPNLDYLHKTRSSPQKQAQSKLFRTQAAEVKQKKRRCGREPYDAQTRDVIGRAGTKTQPSYWINQLSIMRLCSTTLELNNIPHTALHQIRHSGRVLVSSAHTESNNDIKDNKTTQNVTLNILKPSAGLMESTEIQKEECLNCWLKWGVREVREPIVGHVGVRVCWMSTLHG